MRTPHLIVLVSATVLGLNGPAMAKSPEKKCESLKPVQAVESFSSEAKSTSIGGSYAGVGASVGSAKEQASTSDTAILDGKALERQTNLYNLCLEFEYGRISQEEYQTQSKAIRDSALSKAVLQQQAAAEKKQAAAERKQAAAEKNKGGQKKKAAGEVQMISAPGACGRYANMGIQIPKRYTKKNCSDNNVNGRYVFTSTKGKAITCQYMATWAIDRGYAQASKEMSRAKDELTYTKPGQANLTIKCVNTPPDSGKPTRLVLLLTP